MEPSILLPAALAAATVFTGLLTARLLRWARERREYGQLWREAVEKARATETNDRLFEQAARRRYER